MSDITKQASFEERITDRIRKDIGKLMTDEELSSIVGKAVDKIFFWERPNPRYSSWRSGGEPEKLPPLINEIIASIMRERIDTVLAAWMKEHSADVTEAVGKVLQEDAAMILMRGITSAFRPPLEQFKSDVGQKMGDLTGDYSLMDRTP